MTEELPRITLTAGELDVMRKVFDNRNWPRPEIIVTPTGQKNIAKKIEELRPKTMYPGTKKWFSAEAAYQVEILERVKTKVDNALGVL